MTATGFRAAFRLGIFGQGWRDAVMTLVLAGLAIGAGLIYTGLNHGPAVLILKTPLDDLIPVFGPLVIPYDSFRPFIYASGLIFLLLRARLYQSVALAMVGTFLISYLFYVVAQSYVERPLLTGDDLFSRLIRDVYAGDAPYNAFPSLHAGISTVLAIHWWRTGWRIRVPIAIWAALVVVSTVFVKQHYVPDVIAGVALGFAMSVLAPRVLAMGRRSA